MERGCGLWSADDMLERECRACTQDVVWVEEKIHREGFGPCTVDVQGG